MSSDPFAVVREFEQAVCDYVEAPFCVTVSSCTMALLLAVKWNLKAPLQPIQVPKRTYCSVPMSIWHAGGMPVFYDREWLGAYQLHPLPVIDSARWFTSGLYTTLCKSEPQFEVRPQFVCCSFQASKTLGDTQGGCVLHSDPEADAWLRRMRFDGRTEGVAPKDDDFREIGYHCYLSSDVAARLLLKLYSLPRHNEPLPNDVYPDLSTLGIFK